MLLTSYFQVVEVPPLLRGSVESVPFEVLQQPLGYWACVEFPHEKGGFVGCVPKWWVLDPKLWVKDPREIHCLFYCLQ